MNQVAGLSEPRDGAHYFRVLDAKAIVTHKTKQVVYLPVKCVKPSEEGPDEFWLKFMPNHYRSIAKMLSAHIDCRKKGKKGISFEKGSTGSKFIQRLRKCKNIAIKSKYTVTKKRLLSRKKADRALQIAAETIDAPLPSVAGVSGISVQMKMALSKNNGREPLWILVNPMVTDFLALSLEHFEDRESDDENSQVEDRESSTDGEAAADEPAEAAPVSPPSEVGGQPLPVEAQVSTPAPQPAAVSNNALETPSPVAKSAFEQSPIFKAFQRSNKS